MREDGRDIVEFPTDFPIKVIGDATSKFEAAIVEIARHHHPELSDDAIERNISAKGTYLSITITVRAESQKALDALYTELSRHPDTKMVL